MFRLISFFINSKKIYSLHCLISPILPIIGKTGDILLFKSKGTHFLLSTIARIKTLNTSYCVACITIKHVL